MNTIKKLIYLLFLLPSLTIYGQKRDVDNLEQRLVVLNYADSTVKCEIMISPKDIVVDDLLEYYWYYTDELKSNIGGYSGFLLHGKYNVFDLNNNLIVEGYFNDGLRNGTWKRWTTKGSLINQIGWENGQLDGVFVIYDTEGNKKISEEYTKGKLHGKQIIYDGGQEQTTYFKHGEPVEEKSFFKSLTKKEKKPRKKDNKEKKEREPRKKRERGKKEQEKTIEKEKI